MGRRRNGLIARFAITAAALVMLFCVPAAGAAAASAPVIQLSIQEVEGLTVTINGYTAPTAAGSAITQLRWDWGDHQASTGFFPEQHTYANAATYVVTVTATDSDGNSASATITVNLAGSASPPAPPASASTSAPVAPRSPVTWQALGPVSIANAHAGDPAQSSLLASGRLQAFALDAANPQVMYAAGGIGTGNLGPYTETGVYKSVDGGAAWRPVDNGLGDPMVDALWLDQSNPNMLLATTWLGGIFRTTDGGASWHRVAKGQATGIVMVDGTLYAGMSQGVAASKDLGATWQIVDPTQSPVRTLAAARGAIYGGLDDGTVIVRRTPSSTWLTVLQGKRCQSVYDIAADPADPNTAIVVQASTACQGDGSLDNLITHDGGSSWAPWTPPASGGYHGSGGPALEVAYDPSQPTTIYVNSGGFVYVSHDGGVSWSLSHLAEDLKFLTVVVAANGTQYVIAGGDQGIYDSTDGGGTWTCLTSGLGVSIFYGLAVHGSDLLTSVQDFSAMQSFDGGRTWLQLAGAHPPAGEDGDALIDPQSPSDQYLFNPAGFQYSTDGGQTFASAPTLPGSAYVYASGGTDDIALDPSHPGRLYVAAADGVFASSDGGRRWANTGWFSTAASLVVVDPTNDRTIYVGTNGANAAPALYVTHDAGESWTQANLSGASGAPATLAVDPADPSVVLLGMTASPPDGGGLLVSTDGGATFESTGLMTPDVTGIAPWYNWDVSFDPTGSLAIVGTLYGVYAARASALDGPWYDVRGNAIPHIFTDFAWSGQSLYASTTGEGVLRVPTAEIAAAVGDYAYPPDGASQAFRDLEGYSWAASAIYALAGEGVIEGVSPGVFDPGASVTRAQFAALIERIFRLPPPQTPLRLRDVPPSFWAYADIEAVAPYFDLPSAGQGAQDFRPSAPCTREETAAVIVRLLASEGQIQLLRPSDVEAILGKVTDAHSISPADAVDVATAIKQDILLGYADASFRPLSPVTRAQAAVVLQRLLARGATLLP